MKDTFSTARIFDTTADVHVIERRLPHWSQGGTLCFKTWRTYDSMPGEVLARWHHDRDQWLAAQGINPRDPHWRARLDDLGDTAVREYLHQFCNRWHDTLDAGAGECLLRRADLAAIVSESLKHFDGDRYILFDYVIMPNHVHLLASFADEATMLAQCESWKHYTAVKIHRTLKRRGRFWQQDGFDHLVRSEEQFDYLRKYIANNPTRARLNQGEFIHCSRARETIVNEAKHSSHHAPP